MILFYHSSTASNVHQRIPPYSSKSTWQHNGTLLLVDSAAENIQEVNMYKLWICLAKTFVVRFPLSLECPDCLWSCEGGGLSWPSCSTFLLFLFIAQTWVAEEVSSVLIPNCWLPVSITQQRRVTEQPLGCACQWTVWRYQDITTKCRVGDKKTRLKLRGITVT